MSVAGRRILEAAREIAAVARGEAEPARIHFGPHSADKNMGARAEAPRPSGNHMHLNIAEHAPAQERANAHAEERRLVAWLDRMVAAGASGVFSEVVQITPTLARLLLSKNDQNRPISKTAVAKYRRDILNGAWSVNGQTIVISRDGLLNDGQHRLNAIIEAGKSVSAVMVFGVKRESRFTLDQNVVRTAGHYIGMNGVANANVVAAVAGFIWQHKTHGFLSHQAAYRPTKAEILRTANHFVGIEESIRAVPNKGILLLGGRAILTFCHFTLAAASDGASAGVFIARLADGVGLGARDPILYVRNRLIGSTRLSPNEKAELIFRAWNAHRRGETPKTLLIMGGKLPALER